MKQCYLCDTSSRIEEKADGFFVNCKGPCGPYIITRKAVSDLAKIHGRKQNAIKMLNSLRQRDKVRLIRIASRSISFDH